MEVLKVAEVIVAKILYLVVDILKSLAVITHGGVERFKSLLPSIPFPDEFIYYASVLFLIGFTYALLRYNPLVKEERKKWYRALVVLDAFYLPFVVGYLLDSVVAGVLLGALILVLLVLNIGVNFDRWNLFAIVLAHPDSKPRFFNKPLPLDRISGVNVGALVFASTLGLYCFWEVYQTAPSEVIGIMTITLLVLCLAVGSHRYVGILVDIVGISPYVALVVVLFNLHKLSGGSSDYRYLITFGFAVATLGLLGVDLIRGILFDLLRLRVPSGIIGGAGYTDALVTVPLLTQSILAIASALLFNVGLEITSGWVILGIVAIIAFVLAIINHLFFWLIASAGLLVVLLFALALLGMVTEYTLLIAIGVSYFVLAPIILHYLAVKKEVNREGSLREYEIYSMARTILSELEGRIRGNVAKVASSNPLYFGDDGRAVKELMDREFEKALRVVLEYCPNKELRKALLVESLNYLREDSPLREEVLKELYGWVYPLKKLFEKLNFLRNLK